MSASQDFYAASTDFSATIFETNPATWDPTSEALRIGSAFYDGIVFFEDAAVVGNPSLTADGSIDGLRIVGATLTMQVTNISYSGTGYRIYSLDSPIDHSKPWWLNVEPHIGEIIAQGDVASGGNTISLGINADGVFVGGDEIVQALLNGVLIRCPDPGSGYVEINKYFDVANERSASMPPKLTLTCELVSMYGDQLMPNNGYVNPAEPCRLSWTPTYDKAGVVGEIAQASAVVRVRLDGADTYTDYPISGSTTYKDFPANTFATGFSWCVAITSTHGYAGAYTSWTHVSVTDAGAVSAPISPADMFVDGTIENTFSWSHSTTTGTKPTKYALQYSLDASAWTDLASGSDTDATTYTVAADTLPGETVYWRVRTGNADGVWGAWSEPARIVVQAPPVAPVIGAPTGTTIPTITWTQATQQGYEVMIDGVSGGVVYGTTASHTWGAILPDGEHTIKVRVINRFSLWSPWATTTWTAANTTGTAITAEASVDGRDITLTWADSNRTYNIYRDGVLLASGAISPYIDRLAYRAHTYIVRAVDGDGNYADSSPVYVALRLRSPVIAKRGTSDWIRLEYAEGMPTTPRSTASIYTMQTYSGYKMPVAERSTHRSAGIDLSRVLEDGGDVTALRALIGEIVCYKDEDGVTLGLLSSVSDTRLWFGWTVDLHIEEVDADALA